MQNTLPYTIFYIFTPIEFKDSVTTYSSNILLKFLISIDGIHDSPISSI